MLTIDPKTMTVKAQDVLSLIGAHLDKARTDADEALLREKAATTAWMKGDLAAKEAAKTALAEYYQHSTAIDALLSLYLEVGQKMSEAYQVPAF